MLPPENLRFPSCTNHIKSRCSTFKKIEMKEKILLVIIILTMLNINDIVGQEVFQNLNNLPNTIEVKAPEFNTEKKYYFKFDSFQNVLLIQDLRKSKKDKVHYYQFLYEIPLNKLNSKSFKISKDIDNNNELEIIIRTSTKEIMNYMIQDGEISSISASSAISLGNWTYSDSLFKEISNLIRPISSYLSKESSSFDVKKSYKSTFKFIAENVTSINATMDDDLSIGNGYYYEQIPRKLKSKIVKDIKTSLEQQNINYQYPIPVIIHISKDGILESVFVGNQPFDKYCQIDLRKLNSVKIENLKRPIKYLFLIE